jgi:Holliday junction resolvase RusA-like endonuclease
MMVVIDSNVYHSGMNDQADDAHRRAGRALRGQAHNWVGRGKVQASMSGDELNLRVDAVTTQTRRFKSLIGEFFRLEFKRARPKWGPYEVTIEIQRTPDSPTHDVDNVAKAVLDALTGVVFHDDSQVERLLVTKVEGDRARICVTARPMAEVKVLEEV